MRQFLFKTCQSYIEKSIGIFGLAPSTVQIQTFIDNLKRQPGGNAAYYRYIRAFYHWLYSPASGFRFAPGDNPSVWVRRPRVPDKIQPAQTPESVMLLLSHVKGAEIPRWSLRLLNRVVGLKKSLT